MLNYRVLLFYYLAPQYHLETPYLQLLNNLDEDKTDVAYSSILKMIEETCESEGQTPSKSMTSIEPGEYIHIGGEMMEDGSEIPARNITIVLRLESDTLLAGNGQFKYACNKEKTDCREIHGSSCGGRDYWYYDRYTLLEDDIVMYTNSCGSYHYYQKIN